MSEAQIIINRVFYDKLYGKKSQVFFFLNALFSYDQKSKTKVNLRILRKAMEKSRKPFPPEMVLDFGCGFGTLLFALPPKVKLYGVDISRQAIEHCRQMATFYGRNTEFIESDGTRALQWPDEVFDVIVSSHSLEHVENDSFVISELVRCLKKGGLLLVNVPINEILNDPKHVRQYSSTSIESLLECHNLQMIITYECNRWDGFLGTIEYKHSSFSVRLVMRALRGILAILPQRTVDRAENVLISNYKMQQFIAVASKK
jgi:ubiquinone/menaquinone biosynthesis C-methylase UbiE